MTSTLFKEKLLSHFQDFELIADLLNHINANSSKKVEFYGFIRFSRLLSNSLCHKASRSLHI
jgi:hypothetical protein